MRLREVLKSKIHRARITDTKLYYKGSIGIDKTLMLKSDIAANEKVQVLNFNNAARFETYAIEEKEGSGSISLYGPAAKLGKVGDEICILSYSLVSEEELDSLRPKIIYVDKGNKVIKEGLSDV